MQDSKCAIPKECSSFVGRQREIAAGRRLLSQQRLVTLTGTAGVGKTRLAARLATQVRRRFPDGVWWIDVAALHAGHLLAETLVVQLGVPVQPGRWSVEALSDHLRDKRLLLVLDNCEHAAEESAVVIRQLLDAASGLQIMVTSRHTLGIEGETMLTVYPLSVPSATFAHPEKPGTVEGALRYESVRLFQDRAQRVVHGFHLDVHNYGNVVRLCQRLDGIPLAIELAAVRLSTMSVQQLEDRLCERFAVLTRPGEPAFRQHKLPHSDTLRAAVDWSFQLCSAAERRLWTRASVFAGEFSQDAAEKVCVDGELDRPAVTDLLRHLLDKSVLIKEVHGRRVRYRMLETISAYGYDKLRERAEETSCRRRHRDYYRSFALRAHDGWMSPLQVDWFTRVRSEHGNLREALEFCLTTPGEGAKAVDMLIALRYYWVASGALGEARHWLDMAVVLHREPSVTRARALWADSHMALLQSDIAAARPKLLECQALAERMGDAACCAHAQQFLGYCLLVQGDYSQAVELLEGALQYHRDHDRGELWLTLFYLTLARGLLGDLRLAEQCGVKNLALCEGCRAHLSASYALWALGTVRCWQRRTAQARTLVQQSLRLKQVWNDRWGVAYCLEVLAWVAVQKDKAGRAAQLMGIADAIFRSAGTSASRLGHLAVSHQACESSANQVLGQRVFSDLFRRGTELGLDDAVSLALDDASD